MGLNARSGPNGDSGRTVNATPHAAAAGARGARGVACTPSATLRGGAAKTGRPRRAKPSLPRERTASMRVRNTQDHGQTPTYTRERAPNVSYKLCATTDTYIGRAAHSRSSPRPPTTTCPLRVARSSSRRRRWPPGSWPEAQDHATTVLRTFKQQTLNTRKQARTRERQAAYG